MIYTSARDVISAWVEQLRGHRGDLAQMIEEYAAQRVREALDKIVDNSQVKTETSETVI